MGMTTGYSYRRRGRFVRLGLVDRPRRRRILDDKDVYVLELRSTGGESFAELRKNYMATKRSLTVRTMQGIVDIFFKITYGFFFSEVSHIILENGHVYHLRMRGMKDG